MAIRAWPAFENIQVRPGLKQPHTDDQDKQQRQQDVSGVGIDVPNMHPLGDLREIAQDGDRRLKNETIDDVDFGVFAPDCGTEMNGNGLGALLAGGRMQQRSEDDANRIGESRRGIQIKATPALPRGSRCALPHRAWKCRRLGYKNCWHGQTA
jgi:hypothetical protein